MTSKDLFNAMKMSVNTDVRRYLSQLREHLSLVHGIKMKFENRTFNNMEGRLL